MASGAIPGDDPAGAIRVSGLVRLCASPDGLGTRASWAADRLGEAILRRRSWSLHRQVHLVNAFADVSSRSSVERVVSVGCGRGLAELFLAVCHPDVQFTLIDVDPARLRRPRWHARALGIGNVEFRLADLLVPPPAERRREFDLAVGVEVLEHIEQDQVALGNLREMTSGYLYQLVPFCDEADLVDERICARVWRRQGHYRPGYTRRTMEELFAGTSIEWVRTCYLAPEGPALRDDLAAASRRDLRRQRTALVERAAADVLDDPARDREAAGIEVLARCT